MAEEEEGARKKERDRDKAGVSPPAFVGKPHLKSQKGALRLGLIAQRELEDDCKEPGAGNMTFPVWGQRREARSTPTKATRV